MRWPFWKAILILPGFALVYAPAALVWLTRDTIWSAHWALANPPILVLATTFLGAGALLMYRTMKLFHDTGGGTIAPWQPIEKFIVSGPFRYVRNPMLAGVIMVLAGEALLLQSLPLLCWLLFFVGVNTVYFIRLEEPGLARRYGDSYMRYKQAVPRWIPRLSPYDDTDPNTQDQT